MAQDGRPLLLEPEPEPPARAFEGKREKKGAWDHEKGRKRDDDRPGRRRDAGPGKPRRGRSDVPMATYTIAVGKRHKVEPRQIVGAIANEGGLGRGDFGHIDIRGDHSFVELPASLAPETWKALENTRISGKLIALTEGTSAPAQAGAHRKKPRHKKGSRDQG
ncbi:MAG: DbpA RNA binding domain-containing protein [Nocardioides sp.]